MTVVDVALEIVPHHAKDCCQLNLPSIAPIVRSRQVAILRNHKATNNLDGTELVMKSSRHHRRRTTFAVPTCVFDATMHCPKACLMLFIGRTNNNNLLFLRAVIFRFKDEDDNFSHHITSHCQIVIIRRRSLSSS